MTNARISEDKLRSRLKDMFGFNHVALAGRMRSCITAAYETLLKDNPLPCLLPSNVCPTLLMALIDSNAQVELIDVDLETGAANDDDMAQVITQTSGRGIVMLVQNHGYVRDYSKTVAAAKSKDWTIIENDTMSVRCHKIFGTRVSEADILLTSFGGGKGIAAGIGGAAFFKDENLFHQVQAVIDRYPPINDIAVERDNWLIHMRRLMRAGPEYGQSYLQHSAFLLDFEAKELRHRFTGDDADRILEKLNQLENTSQKKLTIYQQWLSAFSRYGLNPSLLHGDLINPGRLVFRITHNRDHIIRTLRENHIDVGTNSPDVREFFPGYNFNKPNHDTISWTNEVVNLWLTDDYDDKKIDHAVSIIAEIGL